MAVKKATVPGAKEIVKAINKKSQAFFMKTKTACNQKFLDRDIELGIERGEDEDPNDYYLTLMYHNDFDSVNLDIMCFFKKYCEVGHGMITAQMLWLTLLVMIYRCKDSLTRILLI